jgi:hypothetical protein
VEQADGSYAYVDICFSEKDGYYHVGSTDGPLLLADLMGYTQWNEERTLWEQIYEGDISVGGHNYYDEMVQWFSYASNSASSGLCPVTQELYDWLESGKQAQIEIVGDIELFCREAQTQAEFDEKNRIFCDKAIRAQILSGAMMPMMQSISTFNYVIIAVVGGMMALS